MPTLGNRADHEALQNVRGEFLDDLDVVKALVGQGPNGSLRGQVVHDGHGEGKRPGGDAEIDNGSRVGRARRRALADNYAQVNGLAGLIGDESHLESVGGDSRTGRFLGVAHHVGQGELLGTGGDDHRDEGSGRDHLAGHRVGADDKAGRYRFGDLVSLTDLEVEILKGVERDVDLHSFQRWHGERYRHRVV